MKKVINIAFLSLLIGLSSCSYKGLSGKPKGQKDANFENIIRSGKPDLLAQIYYEHGNFINSKQFSPIVRAEDVLKNLNNWMIVDIRSPQAYEAGHINGAYNVPKDKVIDFLKNKHKASAYEKVVFVCYSGQMASYVTSITRFSGFDNTYVMLFGMAGWNSEFSDVMKKGYGTRYTDMLVKASDKSETIPENQEEVVGHKTLDLSKLPKLPSKLPTLLMNERAQVLLSQGRKSFLLKADEFFPDYKANPNKYYPIFYLNKAKYYLAHIKGAELFQSRKDLSLDAKLTQIPTDKTVVVYCKTGHTGGNATAYLDMLGYKAKNLMFGANGFMFDLWKKQEWSTDISNLTNDFPVVKGAKRTSGKIVASAPKKVSGAKKPIVKRKKKEVSGGCG